MKSPLSLSIVAIIALFSWWLLSTEQKRQVAEPEEDKFIDLFIKNFTLSSTNESGNTVYTLKANRLEHYRDSEISQIFDPEINIPQAESHWLITAKTGEIDNKQILIRLKNNVIMKNTDSEVPFEISAQSMTINTETQIIESDQSVNIRNGSLNLVSNGMHYDNRERQLRLLSDVNGTYVP